MAGAAARTHVESPMCMRRLQARGQRGRQGGRRCGKRARARMQQSEERRMTTAAVLYPVFAAASEAFSHKNINCSVKVCPDWVAATPAPPPPPDAALRHTGEH